MTFNELQDYITFDELIRKAKQYHDRGSVHTTWMAAGEKQGINEFKVFIRGSEPNYDQWQYVMTITREQNIELLNALGYKSNRELNEKRRFPYVIHTAGVYPDKPYYKDLLLK